ncbi:MAG: hypothetical protein ACYSUZ_04775 [Planctomycetota bacterium]|jgi:hypothetical protein
MQKEDIEQELEDLKKEVRAIIGQIGGVPKFHNVLFNWILIIATGICLVISLLVDHLSVRLLMIELASAAVSVKIIYLMHCQMRVNHFKVWVLSSIEWRISELTKLVKSR